MGEATIHVETAGQGEHVVLLHAEHCDAAQWEPQWAGVAGLFCAVRLDLRGHGASQDAAPGYSHARDVLEVLDARGVGRAALVGSSLGGRVALEVAVARPALVATLVLLAPSLPDHAWSQEALDARATRAAAIGRGALDEAVEADLAATVDRGSPPPAGSERDAVRSQVAALLRGGAAREPQPAEELLVPDIGARLAEIDVPTLVAVGDRDAPDYRAIGVRLERAIPLASLVDVAGAAHFPNLERPDLTAGLLIGFLARSGLMPRF